VAVGITSSCSGEVVAAAGWILGFDCQKPTVGAIDEDEAPADADGETLTASFRIVARPAGANERQPATPAQRQTAIQNVDRDMTCPSMDLSEVGRIVDETLGNGQAFSWGTRKLRRKEKMNGFGR
jgi:hypothetical protein